MTSKIKFSDEDIRFWYQHICKYRESGLTRIAYINRENIDAKKFHNMLHRISRNTDTDRYRKLSEIGRKYINEGNRNSGAFAKQHGILKRDLCDMVTHLKYQDIIERVQREKDSGMQFIEIPQKEITIKEESIAATLSPEADVIQPQNDIEIVISKGVRVCISPSIDSTNIIKIIELLKDL